MGKILSEFVKENLGKKVLILNFNVEGEIVGYNSELPAIIIRSLDQNFGWGNEGCVFAKTNKILIEIDEKDTFWYVEYQKFKDKVTIFNKSNMDEIELIENFGIDIIDVSINLNTVKLQEELSPLEEETLILSDFWY